MQLENFYTDLLRARGRLSQIGSGKTSWMQNGISIGDQRRVRQAISNVIADAIQNTTEVQLNY